MAKLGAKLDGAAFAAGAILRAAAHGAARTAVSAEVKFGATVIIIR